jgi:hypothetical protein
MGLNLLNDVNNGLQSLVPGGPKKGRPPRPGGGLAGPLTNSLGGTRPQAAAAGDPTSPVQYNNNNVAGNS